ncbi:hypothetical protein RR48_03204 [Papilio machaon]|uniref:Uncharacterized protein n=1 Tax=Papilio machaon TaxID=76193 RepID=A0A0N1I8V9_PAPMA|nr:hypothetical protein RR48_03204 [Papilio machaon]
MTQKMVCWPLAKNMAAVDDNVKILPTMCLRVCEFWTWRLMSIYIACVGIFVAFIFGPLQTVVYLTDQHSEMSRLINTEINLALMLWFIVAFIDGTPFAITPEGGKLFFLEGLE